MPPVLTNIDYEHDGRQVSVLRIPTTRSDTGLASVAIPIVVLKNGSGPTVLLTAGTHGDEFEGPVALRKLVQELSADQIQGRLIILPALNHPALMAGQRTSPLDGLDLNRCYPGRPDGSVTEAVTHYLVSTLFPLCDVVLDHHGGGYGLKVMPFMVVHDAPDPQVTRQSLAIADCYGAAVTAIWRGMDAGKNQLAAAERQGLAATCTEFGGSRQLSPLTLGMTEAGIRNALRFLGVLEGEPRSRAEMGLPPSRLVHTPGMDCEIYAPLAGIYESFHEPGEEVEAGRPAGAIHFMDDLTRPPVIVEFARSGLLLAVRSPGQVEHGDGVAIVAVDRWS